MHRGEELSRRLLGALRQRAAAGLDRVEVEFVQAPDAFLAGEESALASWINGGPARPAFKQPPVYERGVAGLPTLVQNVETLAHLALIARFGAGWFRALGTAAEPGTMLATVHRADGGSYITETSLGTPLTALLPAELAGPGASADAVQAVLVGGYHGAWLAPEQAAGLALSNASLRPAGAFAGAGVLAALPPAGAAWPRPPGWAATWPWSRPGSAARASTACRTSPARWTSWPGRIPGGRPWPTCGAGPGWSPGAGPAITPTASSGSCAAR